MWISKRSTRKRMKLWSSLKKICLNSQRSKTKNRNKINKKKRYCQTHQTNHPLVPFHPNRVSLHFHQRLTVTQAMQLKSSLPMRSSLHPLSLKSSLTKQSNSNSKTFWQDTSNHAISSKTSSTSSAASCDPIFQRKERNAT